MAAQKANYRKIQGQQQAARHSPLSDEIVNGSGETEICE